MTLVENLRGALEEAEAMSRTKTFNAEQARSHAHQAMDQGREQLADNFMEVYRRGIRTAWMIDDMVRELRGMIRQAENITL